MRSIFFVFITIFRFVVKYSFRSGDECPIFLGRLNYIEQEVKVIVGHNIFTIVKIIIRKYTIEELKLNISLSL